MNNASDENCLPEVSGTAIMGERGQIVIPKGTRDELHVKPGDKFVVIQNRRVIVLIPAVDFKKHLARMTQFADKITEL